MNINRNKAFYAKPVMMVLAIALALALVLLAGCGKSPTPGADDSDDLQAHAGYYVIDSLTVDGETFDAETLRDAGLNYYLRLNEDGTLDIQTDMFIEGTWEVGILRYQEDGEDVANEYVLENGVLTLEIVDEESVGIFVFKRSSEDAGTADPGQDDDDTDTDGGVEVEVEAHFSLAELTEIYAQLSKDYNDSLLREKVYEEICDSYFDGVEGVLDLDGDTLSIYVWYATDHDEAYVQVSFQDYEGDGTRTAGGIGSYLP